MHGGRIATLVDVSTGISAIVGKSNTSWSSIDLSVSYLGLRTGELKSKVSIRKIENWWSNYAVINFLFFCSKSNF